MPQLVPGERFQITSQEGSTTAEPRDILEFRKQTCESRETKVVEAHGAEYKKGAR